MDRVIVVIFGLFILSFTQLASNVAADGPPTQPKDVLLRAENPIQCQNLEEPTNCKECQATCQKLLPGQCNEPCTPGCKCRFGFVKNSKGNCVTLLGCLPDLLSG